MTGVPNMVKDNCLDLDVTAIGKLLRHLQATSRAAMKEQMPGVIIVPQPDPTFSYGFKDNVIFLQIWRPCRTFRSNGSFEIIQRCGSMCCSITEDQLSRAFIEPETKDSHVEQVACIDVRNFHCVM